MQMIPLPNGGGGGEFKPNAAPLIPQSVETARLAQP